MSRITIESIICRSARPGVSRLPRLLGAVALVTAACSGQTSTTPPGADAAGIVWLCLPGKADNPCQQTLTTTAGYECPARASLGDRTVEIP
jgi:hypothetical protein